MNWQKDSNKTADETSTDSENERIAGQMIYVENLLNEKDRREKQRYQALESKLEALEQQRQKDAEALASKLDNVLTTRLDSVTHDAYTAYTATAQALEKASAQTIQRLNKQLDNAYTLHVKHTQIRDVAITIGTVFMCILLPVAVVVAVLTSSPSLIASLTTTLDGVHAGLGTLAKLLIIATAVTVPTYALHKRSK